VVKPTKEEVRAGFTEATLDAYLREAEKRTASKVFGVFDRKPGLRVIRHASPFDWLCSGPNPRDWARKR